MSTNQEKPAAAPSNVFTLKHPYKTAAGVEIKTLTLRRPKVRDLKMAQRLGSEAEQELALLAAVCEQRLVPEDLEEMDLADYQGLTALFRSGLDT